MAAKSLHSENVELKTIWRTKYDSVFSIDGYLFQQQVRDRIDTYKLFQFVRSVILLRHFLSKYLGFPLINLLGLAGVFVVDDDVFK